MLQPRIELGPKRWQRSILPLNYCSLTKLTTPSLSFMHSPPSYSPRIFYPTEFITSSGQFNEAEASMLGNSANAVVYVE